ncbi:MAG: amino acid kinase family protein, partial [Planctomycetota bacterium]
MAGGRRSEAGSRRPVAEVRASRGFVLRPARPRLESPPERNRDVPRKVLRRARRIVVKVGSNLLAPGGEMDRRFIGNLARQTSQLVNTGREMLIVSSGA